MMQEIVHVMAPLEYHAREYIIHCMGYHAREYTINGTLGIVKVECIMFTSSSS